MKISRMVIAFAALLLNVTITGWVYGDWKQDWDKTVAAAEKEGEVTIYGQSRAGVGKAILAFKDAYPKIKINFVGGSGSDLAKKIMAEHRAGKHLVELVPLAGSPVVEEHFHRDGIWQITLSYIPAGNSSNGAHSPREYKAFEIDAKSGDVLAMKMRSK